MGVKNIAYINKEMLIWARNETPFATSEDVEAHSSSICAEKLSKWESGEDLPSVNEAKRLASIYKVPFACFYLSEVPEKKPKPYTDRRTALGTSYDVISYDLWSEIQRIVSNRECLIEFTEEEDVIPIPSIHDTSIEGIAKQIREFLELKTDTPKIFYIWGHSYEMDAEYITWEKFESICKKLSGRSDIFYGTNAEVLL